MLISNAVCGEVRQHVRVPVSIELKPVETLVFHSNIVALGKFRCPSDHPIFNNSGPCSNHVFGFPRTSTIIRHAEGATFVGGPNSVSIYNQNQHYSRLKIDSVDATDWVVVSDDVLMDAIGAFDPAVVERPARPFVHTNAPVDAETYLEQRRLFEDTERGDIDSLAVEETALRILKRVLSSAYGNAAPSRVQIHRAEAVKSIIAAAPEKNISLRALARAVESSPFHLCHGFRRSAGMSITAYRHSIRLRRSLDRLRDRNADLTAVALDQGYSSHSHFTLAFRRHFGITPSQYRARS